MLKSLRSCLLLLAIIVTACNRQPPPAVAPSVAAAPAPTPLPAVAPVRTNGSQLVVAAFDLDVERVQALLAEGVDPDSRMGRHENSVLDDKWNGSTFMGSEAWTPLRAVASNRKEPPPDQPFKNTSAGRAAAEAKLRAIEPALVAERNERRLKIARALIAAKASLDLDDGHGSTALGEAVYLHHDDLALLLIASGAKLDTKEGIYIDGTGDITPLHRATDRPHLVKAMIDRGVQVNVSDDSGDTPLHWAARDHNVESVKLLLAAGADPAAKDKEGRLPAYWCKVFGTDNTPDDAAKNEITRLLEAATKK